MCTISKVFLTCVIIIAISQVVRAQGWSKEDKESFIEVCSEEAKTIGEGKSIQYCWCMMDKLLEIYDTPEGVTSMDEDALMELATSCLEEQNNWSEETKTDFQETCVKESKDNLGEEQAFEYCNCMLYQLSSIFPNVDDFDLTDSEMVKLASKCLHKEESED